LLTKNADSHKRIKSLELEMASVKAASQEKDGVILGLKRLNESL